MIFFLLGFYTGQHASAEGRRGRCAAGPRNTLGRHRVDHAACRAAGCQYGSCSLRSVQVRNFRLSSLKGAPCHETARNKTREYARVGKNPGFFKKTQPSGFFWVFWVFLGFFGFFWVFLGFFGVFLPRREGF
jgi:hypothetical protein